MRALQIYDFGALTETLKLREVAPAELGPAQVRVKIEAAGINPSDVFNVRGRFPSTSLPRIVGRDFAGTVCEGPSDLVGAKVWGTGGDLGFTRDGAHAEYIVIPAAAVALRPNNLSAEEAAAVGTPFLTAWYAIVELGHLEAGEWVIVSGAAGAVGDAAIGLATARGARVIALVKDAGEREHIDRYKVAAIAQSDRNDLVDVVNEATGGKRAALALNGVGAAIVQPLLQSLADGGRSVVYSVSFGGSEVTLDLFSLYRRRLALLGLNTGAIDVLRGAEVLRRLAPLFENGSLRPPHIDASYAFADAVSAYQRVEEGRPGKVVLVPG
ncbi:MAG: zinc-binding alcohol dehydrogenase family protein [Candidatus Baltobacteraceae bacterium]